MNPNAPCRDWHFGNLGPSSWPTRDAAQRDTWLDGTHKSDNGHANVPKLAPHSERPQ